ncbi:MAG: hypothetical protein AAGA36_00140 [Pseudomonadota bacterium]
MSNILLLQSYDFASVSTSSQASGFPATNVGTDRMEQEWRPSGVTGHVQIDLGEAMELDTFAAINVRSEGTFTMRVRIDDDTDVATAPDWDSNAVTFGASRLPTSDFSHALITRESALSRRYVRFDFDDTGNTGDFGVVRLLVGKRFQPAKNHDYGAETPINPTVPFGRNNFNAIDVAPGRARSDLKCSLPYLTEDEALTDLWQMQRLAAEGKPIMVHMNPTDTTYFDAKMHYGYARSGMRKTHQYLGAYKVNLDLAGVI